MDSLLRDFPLNDPATWLLGLVALVVVGALGLLLWLACVGIYQWLDQRGCPFQTREVPVADKTYTPAHTTYMPQTTTTSGPNGQVTTTTIMVPIFHPDEWDVEVRFDRTRHAVSVSALLFDRLHEGDTVTARYKTGRWSKAVYVHAIDG
jgi:hypothetical protein